LWRSIEADVYQANSSSLTELVGADHILFGSDFPFAPELAATMQVAGLATYDAFTPDELDQVERETARTLFPAVAGPAHRRSTL
jgi:predicted TIM-barrel fold metal-dependent hydrolase